MTRKGSIVDEKPLVSITLLTYNHEKYIEDCLLSILAQDYEHIELLILDDASRDGTARIVDSYLNLIKEKFDNVLFIKNHENTGNIPLNMNRMLKKAKGMFCKMLSGDDILEQRCISKLVVALLEHPQCSVVYSNGYIVQDGYKRREWNEKVQNLFFYKRSQVESKNLFRKLMFGNHILAPAAMIKSSVLAKYGYLDEKIAYEDYEYWLRLSSKKEKFYYLNECLVYYRKSITSISNYKSGNKINKIKKGMMSDRMTYNKYLQYLSLEDKLKCIQYFYYRYLKVCWDAKYWRGFYAIIKKLKDKEIEIPKEYFTKSSISKYEQTCERNKMVIKILEKWISNVQEGKFIIEYFRKKNIKSIGIYGLGCVASRLCDELNNTEIEIRYIIDRNADRLISDFRLVTLDNNLEEVDTIVVTPVDQFELIRKELEKKIGCSIVHIEDILFNDY